LQMVNSVFVLSWNSVIHEKKDGGKN